jgi:cytochrome c biogenesis protein CcmG/thiol:disulfide interchange protein DsbE
VRRIGLPGLAVAVAAVLVGLLIYGVASKGVSHSIDEALAAGHHPQAPVKSLPLLDGTGKRSLADYRGQVVVLNFWASWCEPCKAEAPLLERWQRRLRGHGATVLGVTYQDSIGAADSFERAHHVTYPSLRDASGDYAHAFGTDALPETFVVDRAGRIVAAERAEVDDQFLTRALAPLLGAKA